MFPEFGVTSIVAKVRLDAERVIVGQAPIRSASKGDAAHVEQG
jgi:hypothetical protein